MTKLSIDLGDVVVENEDDNKDEEEELHRQDELNGILATAFDDLSSVTEDDDEEKHANLFNCTPNIFNGKTASNQDDDNWPAVTSTPQLFSFPRTRSRKYKPGRSPIDEHHEPESNLGAEKDSCPSSIECLRGTLPNPKYLSEKSGSLPPQHVQMLLDQNEKLSKDNDEMRCKLKCVNEECETLKNKCEHLHLAVNEKKSEIIDLNAKIRKLEQQLKDVIDAQTTCSTKLAVTKATTDTLNDKVSEFSHKPNGTTTKKLQEEFLTKVRHDYENKVKELTEELHNLKWEVESKKQEVILMSSELQEKEKLIETLKSDNATLARELSKMKELHRSTVQIKDKTVVVDEKDRRIALLEFQVDELKRKLDVVGFANNTGLNHIYDSVIADLKVELERALKNAEIRREQNSSLQNQLLSAKAELSVLRERIKLKDEEIKLQVKAPPTDLKRDVQNDVFMIVNENDVWKSKVCELEAEIQELSGAKDQCKKLMSENEQLTQELQACKNSFRTLLNEKTKIFEKYDSLVGEHNDKLLNHKGTATDSLTNGQEEKFRLELTERLKMEQKKWENEKNDALKKSEEEFRGQIATFVNCMSALLTNQESEVHEFSPDMNSFIEPLQKLWREFTALVKLKESALLEKAQQLKQAREELEEALKESHYGDTFEQDSDTSQQCRELKLEVKELKEASAKLQAKIIKYKKHYHRLLEVHVKEVEDLKEELAKAFRSQDTKSDSIMHQKYIESLREIKMQIEKHLSEGSRQTLDKISHIITEYKDSVFSCSREQDSDR